MADGHGGQRTPANPAAVSGPGALSARTDGGPANPTEMVASSGAYGDRKDMETIQSGAQMMPDRSMLPGLMDPTSRPDEPVTAGAPVGPGIGPQAAGIASGAPNVIDENTRQRLLAALPTLAWLASQPKASEQTRQFFRQVRGDL